MKIVEINMMAHGSTGKIMLQTADLARKNGHEVWVAYPDWSLTKNKEVENKILIGNRYSRMLHFCMTKITGFNGCFSYFSTKNFLRKIKKIKPDVIHLHNLHNAYINLPLLFKYIKKNNIKVLWTLHDCWAFTGQCAHFTIAKCDKWKTGCHHCKTYKEYPPSYVDRTKKMWKLKKKWFTGIKDATIITPSQWLGDLVKQSYLGEYPVKVINNGIDLSVFKPTESDFRKKHNLENKHILLGVALFWDYKKGLDVFIELSKRLDDRYQIVLVGTSDEVDKQLPNNIISIHRTQNQEELAEIYSTADVLLNPTREDTFPTVNIESLACGTPIVTFNTGGSPEIINETCGVVTEVNDVDHMEKAIRRICEEKPYSKEACVSRASNFDKDEKFKEYVELY
jgi:glycosyltransferase involved in cell wall biosynthesis